MKNKEWTYYTKSFDKIKTLPIIDLPPVFENMLFCNILLVEPGYYLITTTTTTDSMATMYFGMCVVSPNKVEITLEYFHDFEFYTYVKFKVSILLSTLILISLFF